MSDKDSWDRNFDRLNEKLKEDQKAHSITLAVIFGRLSLLHSIESAAHQNPTQLGSFIQSLRETVDEEIATGCIDLEQLGKDSDFGINS